MSVNRLFNYCLIGMLITILESGFVLVPSLGGGFGGTLQAKAPLLPESEQAPEITRYYVAKTGDGSDPSKGWKTAFKNLQDALNAAAAISGGGEIWVVAGVYYPDVGVGQTNNSQTSTFLFADKVKLYGGFDTNDTKLSDRDWEKNVTVLSGDIDGNDFTDGNGVVLETDDINGKNAIHVVTATSGNTSGVLDGFTITAGFAYVDPSYYNGGGLYCDGSGRNKICSPTLSNVVFSGNLAWSEGGAMYNNGYSGTSSPRLSNVTFSGNYARFGGAMHNNGDDGGLSSPTLTNVTFSGNSAEVYGGAMYNASYEGGESSPNLINVTFSGNSASWGGAIYNDGDTNGNSSPSLKNVSFSGNSAHVFGGAIFNSAFSGISSPSLEAVTFTGNSAGYSGGAIYNLATNKGISSPNLTNVQFYDNSAVDKGGAMYNDGSMDEYTEGTSSPSMSRVAFSGNSAKFGGAIYNDGSEEGTVNMSLTNGIFSGNLAETLGGAIYNDGSFGGSSKMNMVNVTFSGNTAGTLGGAVFNNGVSGVCNLKARNSILWNNRDSTGTGTILATIYNNAATTTFTHSLAQGTGASGGSWTSDTSYVDGGGNIDVNPSFVKNVDPVDAPTNAGNLHLKDGSPAVDAGDNSFIAGILLDLDGKIRITDGNGDLIKTVDMGAYETKSYYPYELYQPLVIR